MIKCSATIKTPALNTPQRLWALPPLLVFASALAGWLGSARLTLPGSLLAGLPFTLLRPLHSLLFIAAMLLGQMIWAGQLGGKGQGALAGWRYGAFVLFLTTALYSLFEGTGSGREYFTWQPWSTAALAVSQALHLHHLWVNRRELQRRSPEGFWLIGFGGGLVLLGLLESELRHLPVVAGNYVRDLTIQWHAIDGFWAGLNAGFLGLALFLVTDQPKPPRSGSLFLLALFTLLFTFGHHLYTSAQPAFLKYLALAASLLVLVSLLKHLGGYRRAGWAGLDRPYLVGLVHSVQFWLLVAMASGILFAIPQVNLLVHGTYLVLIHAMSAAVGINVLLLLAACLFYLEKLAPVKLSRVRSGVILVNLGLGGLWLVFAGSALVKAIKRLPGDYYQYQPLREIFWYGFFALGSLLLLGIGLLCTEALRLAWFNPQSRRTHTAEVTDAECNISAP